MATPASDNTAVTADDVLHAQFTHIRKGGYDTQEVDGFLDRVAQTLDANAERLPTGSMTGADVRAVQFTQVKKGGYDTQEVDNFLDQVVALMTAPVRPAPPVDAAPDGTPGMATPGAEVNLGFDDLVEDTPAPMPRPEPTSTPPPTPVASAPAAQAAAPVVAAAPLLHDPGGAAQKLLAAAQQTADILTTEAQAAKREADEYAAATRAEADEHAARVTATAETQAAAIRDVAAEEARRMAEEARAAVVDDIAALEARKAELAGATAELESVVAAERSELLSVIDALRDRVAAELPSIATHAATGHSLDDDHDTTDLVAESIEDEVDAAFSAAAPVQVADEVSDSPVADEPAAVVEDATAQPEAELEQPEAELEQLEAELEQPDAAFTEPPVEVAQPEVAEAASQPGGVDLDDDAAAEASRSVFDLVEDQHAEADTDWLEDDLAPAPTSTPPPPVAPETPSGSLFDIEADPDWQESQGEAQAGGSGESFFDELRQAETEGSFGPLDDDTDAALSAFFEGDEPDNQNGRWRDRFGPTS